ncbi:hypothetical protein J6590_076753 [Homalodisca vitripennis]|nr:hypothetical protein J6590_076753 [Homalodisca vitripennis]
MKTVNQMWEDRQVINEKSVEGGVLGQHCYNLPWQQTLQTRGRLQQSSCQICPFFQPAARSKKHSITLTHCGPHDRNKQHHPSPPQSPQGCGFIAPNLLAPNLIPPTEKKSSFRCCDIRRYKVRYCATIHGSFRCRETVSSFSVTAPLALFQRGLGGDRGDGGESNLAPHPAPDDPPLLSSIAGRAVDSTRRGDTR